MRRKDELDLSKEPNCFVLDAAAETSPESISPTQQCATASRIESEGVIRRRFMADVTAGKVF